MFNQEKYRRQLLKIIEPVLKNSLTSTQKATTGEALTIDKLENAIKNYDQTETFTPYYYKKMVEISKKYKLKLPNKL